MSQIFDALQRSETERSGADLSGLSGVTELLRRAEHDAASKWANVDPLAQPDATDSAKWEASLGRKMEAPTVVPLEERAATESRSTDVHSDVFDQIQSMQISLPAQSRLVCIADGGSPAAEAFRYLGVRLRHLRRDRPLKKILITSTIPHEGKSVVAANLACTLAQKKQQKTLLLEGDVRRPSLSQLFGLGRGPGMCECLQSGRSLTASIYHLEGPDLWILPAGTAPSHPLELLQSGGLPALMEQLTAWFDWIVIDSPPLLPLADTSVWARMADGILMVTRPGITHKRQLKRGLEALESNKLIGALLNCSRNMDESGYYYHQPAASLSDDTLTK
jgi:capsular exopolysaccharide synthesis family protein